MKPRANTAVILLIAVAISTVSVSAQLRQTREQYIERYKGIAIEQMDVYGIPASIKMAQAIHESEFGNSRLAREANNHFGIKCKSTWTGATISHTDDAPDECFRKYSSVEDSFLDHSEFIDKSERYQALFKLDPMDYKGWAYGLKQAGYATNPNYPQILIKIIEENQLYMLDQGVELAASDNKPQEEVPVVLVAEYPQQPPRQVTIDIDNFTISGTGNGATGRSVFKNNGSEYILARAGDSYASIASQYSLSLKKILSYNDMDYAAALNEGDIVYIRQKNKKSQNGRLIHVAKDGETMHSISQHYGIRLSSLSKINRRTKDSEIRAGQQIRLI